MAESSRPLWPISIAVRLLVALVPLGAGVAAFQFLSGLRAPPEMRDRAEPVLAVRAVRAAPVSVPRIWSGYGTARAMDAAAVRAQVAARVIERPDRVESGVRVAAGDVLVRLEPNDFEDRVASLAAARAATDASLAQLDVRARRLGEQVEAAQEELALAERELERMRNAVAGGAATETDIDTRLAVVRTRERALAGLREQLETVAPERQRLEAEGLRVDADLRTARLDVERATVVSPIDGTLQSVDADVGELLAVGASVARVVDLSRVEVPLRVPVSALGSISVGDRATLTADNGSSWTGAVSRVAPETSEANRTATVFVEVAQDPVSAATLLRPGQFLMGAVESGDGSERLALPRAAVKNDSVMIALGSEGEPGATRSAERRVRVAYYIERSLPALHPRATQWAVLEPIAGDPDGGVALEPGSVVIISNLDQLTPGRLVEAEVLSGMPSVLESGDESDGGAR